MTGPRPNWRESAVKSRNRSGPSRSRGERFVIPVKTEQRRRVQGVAHGASSSGQTVFIEPLETIEQNNDLVRLLEDEQAEVHRILLEMTERLGEHALPLLEAVNTLAELEL